MRILFIGDVFGQPGVRALDAMLPKVRVELSPDLVIANGENVSGGLGITHKFVSRLKTLGVDVITSGNHIWDNKEIIGKIDDIPFLIRPANYPPAAPGKGWCVVESKGVRVGVLNISGRIFMEPLDCPFRTADEALEEMQDEADIVMVDFHAEATSEKRAMGFYLDGRVAAVIGTHTHVATADAQVLEKGTGYITDVGMTGPADSVIGVPKERAIKRFTTGMRRSFGVAPGKCLMQGALVAVDEQGGCVSIERVERRE